MNKKLHRKWEEKIGKKFVLYQEFNKKKSGSKNRKEESSSDSLDDDNAHSDLDNSDTYIFAKKKSGYLCVHLNRKNRSLIKQEGILFNTRAETHIAKSINNFNTGIYVPASLPSIDTVSGEATLFSFGKRTIIYIIDIKKEMHTLNLNKIQYLLNYGINIFKTKKLLGKGDI